MPSVRPRVRVVSLTDLIGPIGGAEQLVAQLAARIDRERFEPIVYVSRWAPGDDRHPGQGDAVAALRDQGVRVVGLGRRTKPGLVPFRRLVAELRDGVDVLHTHSFGSNVWGAVLGSLSGTPVVVAHEHTWSFEGQPLRKLLDRHVIARGADVVVAVSREDRRRMIEVERIPPERIRYIPNGAPPGGPGTGHDVRAELGIPPDAPVVGSVGILRAQKAFDVLVDAAVRLRDRHPGLRVLIAGYGTEHARLAAHIADRGLGDVVTLLGHREDVADVIRAFDVAVSSSDYEGMPLAVIEYMEAGRPVVATRVGGLPDLIVDGEQGLLVPRRDPDALAGAISRLLEDAALRERMGESGRARRDAEFDLDRMVRRVEDLYLELLERRSETA